MVKRIGLVVMVTTTLLALGGAAIAKPDPSNGGGSSSAQAAVTEDNDSDGVANCPDPEGDSDNQHPSGNDKHCEAGNSGNQGKAKSDPDDDGRGPDRSNGGVDQPGGSGGSDQLDQDGNNGCGNDDDFEDDNEGKCLGRQGPKDRPSGDNPPPAGDNPPPPGDNPPSGDNPPASDTSSGESPSQTVTIVLGAGAEQSPQTTKVLGVKLVAGQPLARTGISLVPALFLALVTLGIGILIQTRGRKPAVV